MLLKKLLTDRHDIDAELRIKRKKGIEKTIAHKKRDILLDKIEIEKRDDWKILRENSKSFRLVKDKEPSIQLEDDLWSILARMGFNEMSSGRDFTINVGDDVNPRQIDVFAKDDETAILVECTCSETPKKKNMSHLIEKIISIKSNVAQSINSHYGKDPKLKQRWVIATRNIEWGNADLTKAKTEKIIVLRDQEIQYYDKLTSHLKIASKYQFLAHLFSGETISGLNLTVPATKGKMGGKSFYNFLINPLDLMKIVYVSHKASRDIENLETYQRMLQPKRLKNIAEYIDSGGQFPTNIVINFKSNKKLRFDKKESIGDSAFGTLYLPPEYCSAWIIDGQHRIYGYAHSLKTNPHKKNQKITIPVLAYENLSPSAEAGLFVDINCQQVKVSKNLLNEIYANLNWDSSNTEERLYALRSRIIMGLDSRKTSPFHDRFTLTGKDKSNYRCLTLTSFSDGLKDNKFFGDSLKPGYLTHSSGNLESTLKKGIELLILYFNLFASNATENWELGDSQGGFLCTNNAIRALLKLLKEILSFIDKHKGVEPEYCEPEELLEHIKLYTEPVVDFFANASSDEILRFRRQQALKGVRLNTLRMMQLINNVHNEFTSIELEKYLETIDEKGTKEAGELVDNIQQNLFSFMINKLKEKFNSREEEWWYEGIPEAVRTLCVDRKEKDKGQRNKEQYICLIDYYKIAYSNWSLFKDYLSFSKDGGKEKQLKWIKDLNEVRNITHHTEKWPATKDQVAMVRGIHTKLTKKLEER